MNITKQGIRDLNNIGLNKKNLNGRTDRGQNTCFHIWEDCIDGDYVTFRRCQKCNYEPIN